MPQIQWYRPLAFGLPNATIADFIYASCYLMIFHKSELVITIRHKWWPTVIFSDEKSMYAVAYVPVWFLKFLLELWSLSTKCKMFTALAGKINTLFIVRQVIN